MDFDMGYEDIIEDLSCILNETKEIERKFNLEDKFKKNKKAEKDLDVKRLKEKLQELKDGKASIEELENLLKDYRKNDSKDGEKKKLINENILSDLENISEKLEVFKEVIKNNKPHIKIKDIKKGMLKKHKLSKDYKRHKILKDARKKAHTVKSNTKRDISNKMRDR